MLTINVSFSSYVELFTGLNQLLWYYSDLERAKCYHQHEDFPDFDHQERACTIWRRFTKLVNYSKT